jgi:3-methyladenine DNA glycosylase AlkD
MSTRALLAFVQARLSAEGDSARAARMAAYMKTDMPFYGVQKPARAVIFREMVNRFPVEDRAACRAAVAALWGEPHREEKYLAIALARHHDEFVTRAEAPAYERMIREGAWWDFVDEIAMRLIGRVLERDRAAMAPLLAKWIDDEDMWIRRSAIIAQVAHKDATDAAMLFEFCRRRAHEKEFFIRKAIGWALRTYAEVDPPAVRRFLRDEKPRLSGLSYREAARALTRARDR